MMNTKSKMEEAIERKEALVQKRANTMLNDTSHDWLRTPAAQRITAVVYVLSAALMTILWLFSPIVA